MDRQLAERMVGAAVLLTVLVLVVPALLDGRGDAPAGRTDVLPPPVLDVAPTRTIRIEGQDERAPPVPEARVPARPLPVPESPGPEPVSPGAVAASEPAAVEADVATVELTAPATVAVSSPPPAPATATPPPPASAPAPKPAPAAPPAGDWVVQLGSFANAANAQRLAAQVQARGFGATVSETGSGTARRYIVRSGPPTTRESADRLAAEIKAAGFQVMVARR